MMLLLPYALAGLAGVCLCAGCNHLQTATAAWQQRSHRLFAAMCFMVAAGAGLCIASTQSSQAMDSVSRVRWIITLVCVINLLFPWLIAAYTGARSSRFCIAISALYAVLLVTNWLLPYGLWFLEPPTLQPRVLPWGEQITGYGLLPDNVWRTTFWAAQFVMFMYFFVLCGLQFRRGQRRRALILAASIGVLLLGCGNDWLVSIGVSRWPNTGLFGFLALILLMSWELRHEQRQADKQKRDLLNHVPAVIYVKDLLGRYLFINRHFEQLTNITSEYIQGKTDAELFTPLVAQQRTSRDDQVLTARQPQRFEEAVEKDGVLHTYLSLKFPLGCTTTTGSKPYAIANVSTDITERMRTEQALRSSEAQTRLLLDATEQGIMGVDMDGRCTFVNRAGLLLLGYEHAQALQGELIGELIYGDTANAEAGAFAPVRHTLQNGQRNYSTYADCYRRDGSAFAMEYGSHPMRSKGAIIGAVISFTDISERKRVDDAIRALAEASASLDSEGFFRHCVRSLAEVYGTQCAVIGLFNHDRNRIYTVAVHMHGAIVPNFDYSTVNTPCEKISAQSRLLVVENLARLYPNEMLINKNMESYFGARLVSRSGLAIGIVAVLGQQPLRIGCSSESMLDVFANRISVELDRKLALDRLNELNDSLERRVAERTRELSEINEELEAFSYSVSHDLRAPLMAIDGFSKLLIDQRSATVDDTAVRLAQHIAASAQRMNVLIDALLSLARISRQTLRLCNLDITALAIESINKLRTAQPERSIEVSIAPQLTAYADQGLLSVVLDNLLSNAWKYTTKTSNAHIELGEMMQAGERVYYIRDNGAGFDPQYAHRLFQPFQRLHHEKDFPGTGIGLTTVARIVRHHGGRIWAESTPGLGAGFYFTLQQPKLLQGAALMVDKQLTAATSS